MINTVPSTPVGSIWSVPQLGDASLVVLSGPFVAGQGSGEYLVAPLYSEGHPGFAWTSDDVLLTPEETGLSDVSYAALWNARPVLEADLGLQLGALPREVAELLRDFYWASINEKRVGKHERLGKEIRSADELAARFQARELERWEPLSGRVFLEALSAGTAFVRFDEAWTLTPDDIQQLEREIEESEGLLGAISLDAVGEEWVRLTTSLDVSYQPVRQILDSTLFDHVQLEGEWWTYGSTIRTGLDPEATLHPETSSDDLAEAA